ncbi:hypothetical protein PVAND_007105 [Polypedilum vanderplanki]|uniref:Nucleic-acid-binding protein from mobile element jockey n=1 Tax=Polypedilum vanderplanki TaxID=319348 RepID=A0A9J6C5D4_POLVA|nr:hypothetical protein PVAND_007105 [Polypedilum vanderplanki]
MHIRVQWEFFQNKFTGPTQCNNCQRFGHGAQNCHANPRCIRCAKDHSSKSCPLLKLNTGTADRPKIPEEKLCCIHCGQRHTANFSKCTKRLAFTLNRANKTAQTHKTNLQKNKHSFQHAPQLNEVNFPFLNNNSNQNAWTNNQQTKTNNNKNQSEVNNNFSFDPFKIFTIVNDVVQTLTKTRNMTEVFQAVFQLAQKYLTAQYV